MTAEKTALNSYDEIPYKSYPYPQSHPDRLATVATLFGMTPPPIDAGRVLELGCCSGGNLIPMAERLPGCHFVGIDYSQKQIAEGQAFVKALGLQNIELRHGNILEVGSEFGQFDYILCHGVYSWVPDECQARILQICSQNLAEHGVAYVSYNTYPGWHMRGMIRDIMCYRARAFTNPADRIRHARGLIDFLSQSVPTEDNAYGILLKNELNLLNEKDDSYLLHDHLEENNQPVYFYQFIERAEANGLQYLGESDFRVMSASNFPRQVEAMLHTVASDMIQLEQYMDFVRNRMFRQTLLCHRGVSLDRSLSPERILNLHVASSSKPEGDVEIGSSKKATFRGPNAVTSTTDRLMKAAMLHLGNIWPLSTPFSTLLATARSRLNPDPVVVDTAQVTRDGRRLAEPLLQCYATTQVELSIQPPAFTLEVTEQPTASRVARHQAVQTNRVTNLRHESVALNDLQRHVLQCLDGRHRRADVLDSLMKTVDSGKLVIHEAGHAVKDAGRIRQILDSSLDDSLRQLGRQALLMG